MENWLPYPTCAGVFYDWHGTHSRRFTALQNCRKESSLARHLDGNDLKNFFLLGKMCCQNHYCRHQIFYMSVGSLAIFWVNFSKY